MAGNLDPSEKQASWEATDWLILLQEEPENEELHDRFEAWRRRSPLNAAAWEETQRVSHAIGGTAPAHAERWKPFLDRQRRHSVPAPRADAARDSSGSRPGRETATYPGARARTAARRPRRRQAFRLGGMAAAAVLIGIVSFLAGPDLLLDLQGDHATGTAETRTVRLADDSTVTLAPRSAITVAYGEGERRVELLAGEAFFEVTPNARRPFRVSSRAITVTVLGTAFDVRRDAAGTGIAVEQGTVRVDHAAALPPVAETLTVGQSAHVSWSGTVARASGAVARVAAWRRNQLIAEDQPLGEVVDQLRRYYRGRIIVTDAALAARPVTGVYNLADPVEAVRGIARAQNAVVRRITPWLLLVSPS